MRRDDWLLAQLPVGMVQDEFFTRFVSIFQEVATTLLDDADNIENSVDLTVTPEPMLRWLATWIGVPGIDPTLPAVEQRRIVRTYGELLAWRGTRHGLQRFLEMLSGAPALIEDGGGVFGEGLAPAQPAWARLHVTSTGWLTTEDFIELVRDEVPAHVALEIWVGGQRLWPQQVDAVLALPDTRSVPMMMADGETTS
jgi:phage tail-like protein